jgi:integrase
MELINMHRKTIKSRSFNNSNKRRAREIKERRNNGTYKPQKKDLSFDELVNRFFQEKHFNKEATKIVYKRAVDAVHKDQIRGTENTKRLIWRHLKAIYNWGIDKGYVSDNPYEDKPTNSIPKVDYYSDKEILEIFNELTNSKQSDLIRFAFLTGARRGELANFSKEDINEHNIILKGKSGARPFPINDRLQEIIDRGLIFEYNTYRAVESALKRVGLNATKIRHTFATRLVKNGMNLYKVSKLMGHKSVKTTEKYYAHLKPSDARDYRHYLKIPV